MSGPARWLALIAAALLVISGAAPIHAQALKSVIDEEIAPELAEPAVAPASAAAPASAPKSPPAIEVATPGGLKFPALTGRVVDAANILPPDVEARINQKLTALETQSRRQLVVATVPSLNGYEISDYGFRLGRAWGIGSNDKNDGALLIVAPNERKLRIEVGYGLEGILTDGLSSLIIQQAIVPKFKAGDMAGGIEVGTDALVQHLALPEEEARKIAAQAKPRQSDEGGIPISTIFWLIIFFIFFVLPLLRSMRGGRRYSSGMGPVIVWGGSGGGSSWGGGGGFGGGGFSGGGGSFGGGGSSGSW